MILTHPEVNLEVACGPKLPVADLEGDGHGVTLVEHLVEAVDAVGGEDDVVGGGSLEGHRRGQQ